MNKKKYVLFVEDDSIDRMAAERVLKEDDDFEFYTASSYSEAVAILKKEHIDVVVADYSLGDGSGIDLIMRFSDIPVIIITGTNDIEVAVTAMRAGAYDFLVKDIDRSYLQVLPIACHQVLFRKNQELRLQKLTQAVEQNPSLILITDVDGCIEYANPKFLEITEYSNDELMGTKTNIFKSGHHDQKFYANLWETVKSGKKWTGELYNKTKSGTLYWELASIAPLMTRKGKITHFIKVGENITELKNAENERIESGRLQGVLEMAGTISHEFNQPLQIILGYSELLKEKVGADDPAVMKQLENIVKNVNRMLETSDKLKNITKYKTLPYLEKGVIIDIHNVTE